MSGERTAGDAQYDLIVRGGTVVTPERSERLDVAVSGDRVAAVGPPDVIGTRANLIVDAGGCLVIPGGVDPHVHYNLQFGSIRSEPQSFSPAAAYGGTTTVIDFALQQAPQSLHDAVAAKRAEATGAMAVDYGLHAIVAGPEVSFEVLDEIGDLIQDGVPSFKAFMTYGWMVDDGYLWGLMTEVAERGGMTVVHAEDDAIANWRTRKYMHEGKSQGAYISETRDSLVEEAAVRRAMLLAERSGSPLYVLHMAAARGVTALAEGRAKGLPFYGETITPYLSFTSDALWQDGERGLLWNNYPTLKSQTDQDGLWRALSNGDLQVAASDHFSTTVADHQRMGTTVDQMQAGHANVELRIPVVYHLGVAQGRLSLERFVEVVATDPARIMGLYPRKGTIAVGSDADIVVLDPHQSWTVRHDELHMRADYSCWDGWELQGKVVTTILRGTPLVLDGRWVGPTAAGQFIARTLG